MGYDPFGRRIEKISPTSGTTIYAYDGDNVVEQLNASGSPTARFTQGPGIDEPLEVQIGRGNYYYSADGLGSVVALTKSNGPAVNTYFGYNTFGWVNATDTVANPFRFTGREWDSETNLYYYRARYYDPLWGRFLSEDPIRFGGGVDFYPYARNNPVTRVDPTGLIHQAWNEPPYDGRLHDDTSGLEVLCTNPRTLARDIGWLVHSIAVRSVEIASLGKNADLGHAIRLEEEIATLARCNECRDRDKKPDQEHEPTWEGVKDSAKKLVNKVADYCSQHPAVCIGVGISLGPVLFPPPVPVPE